MADGLAGGRGGVLNAEQVVFDEAAVQVPVGELPRRMRLAPEADGAEPEVKLTRGDDGSVKQITVHCPCGREITLQCEYLAQGENDAKQDS
ncbi:MAG: hypothetical protein ACYS1C_12835 [Planctomycetota bacterium]